MSCPDAAGTITGGPPLDVSITDRSATLPAAVPDGPPLFCEHFMARHILCFHITGKFVLSLSRRPPGDSLNDVVQLRVLAPSASGRYARCEQTLPAAATHTWTRRHTWTTRATGDSRVGSGGEALCWEKGRWGGLNSSLSELHPPQNTMLWLITDTARALPTLWTATPKEFTTGERKQWVLFLRNKLIWKFIFN